MIKNDDTKCTVYSVAVSFSIFRQQQYTRTTVISNNINIDNQEAQVPSIKIFANQFKCTSREKFIGLVLKGAISGSHIIFLCHIILKTPS